MSNRILDRQKQLAEQGRLRLGYTKPATKRDGTPTTRPVASHTWIVTSDNRDHVARAAEMWGGEVEHWQPMGNGAKQWRVITETNAVPAILPPGDPLSESYEMWSAGGCQRRCNGATEEFSGSPCMCLAQHGEKWYELSARQVCQSKSRLKVLLPDMEGLGAWRMETGSYYGAITIAGMVDIIRGVVGEQMLVPVWLRIKPETRVARGETKQFVIPVLELRGVSAGALLSGEAEKHGSLILNDPTRTPRELEQSRSGEDTTQPAEAPSAPLPTIDDIEAAVSPEIVYSIFTYLTERQAMTPDLDTACKARVAALQAVADPDGAFEADVVDDGDADAVWQQVVTEAGRRGMTLPQVTEDYKAFSGGLAASTASAAELAAYLEHLAAQVSA